MKRQTLIDERKERNMTQEYVANEIGITKQAYSNIENGNKNPSYEVVCKLEDLFNKSHRKLFT